MPPKAATLHSYFQKPKTPGNSKSPTNNKKAPPSSSKRAREETQKSDAELLQQLTTAQPVSQPDTPAPGPRRKKLRTLLGDGEDKQTASYRFLGLVAISSPRCLECWSICMQSFHNRAISLMLQGSAKPICLAGSAECP